MNTLFQRPSFRIAAYNHHGAHPAPDNPAENLSAKSVPQAPLRASEGGHVAGGANARAATLGLSATDDSSAKQRAREMAREAAVARIREAWSHLSPRPEETVLKTLPINEKTQCSRPSQAEPTSQLRQRLLAFKSEPSS